MKKRLIAALLSLCMLLGMAPLSVLAAQPVYVALGDSISKGYGLDPEEGGQSFVEQIAEQQELSVTMLAADGETTASLLAKLADADGAVAEALETADVVTLTIGGNDFMNALYEYMAEAYNAANGTSFTAEQFKQALEGKNEELEQAAALAFVTQNISGFAFGADGTLLTQFETALSGIALGIRGYTEAPVVVATQYNPYRFAADELKPFEQVMPDQVDAAQAIADAFDTMLALMNAKIKALEAQEGFFTADVFSAFDEAQQNPCNASFLSSNLDFHPNAYGHTLMAQTVGEVVQSALNGGTVGSTDITVGGVTLSYVDAPVYASTDEDGTVTPLGENEGDKPWNIRWNGEDGVLTLDGAVIAAPDRASEAVTFKGDLVIFLQESDSRVEGTVRAGGSLKVMGDAGLEITGGEGSQAVSTEDTPAGQGSPLTVQPAGDGAMAVWKGEDADTAEEIRYSPFTSETETTVSGRYVRFEMKGYPFVLPERLVYDKNSPNDLFLGLYIGGKGVSSLSLEGEELVSGEQYEILSSIGSLTLKRDFVDGLEAGEHTLTLMFDDNSSVELALVIPEVYTLTIEVTPEEGGSCWLVEDDSIGATSVDETYYVVVGEKVSFLAEPDWDYRFVRWEKDGELVSEDIRYTFTPEDDCTLTLVFEEVYYELEADPASVSFGSVTPGYTQPEAKEVSITNNGNDWVSLGYLSLPDNFEITWPEEPEWPEMLGLDPGETLSFQVVPKAGLDVGRYSETFTVYANLMLQPRAMSALTERSAEEEGYLWNTKVEIELSFTVRNRSNGSGGGGGPVSYTLSFETGEGSKVDSVTKVSGTTVDLDDYVSTREGYEFTGWYDDRETTEKIGSVTLRGDKTVYAGWEKTDGKDDEEADDEKASFDDVLPGHWAYEAVEYVRQKGLMSGVGGGSFGVDQTTTRAMLVTILYRLEGEPELEGTGTIRFSDVEDDAWYAKGVYWAAEKGIVNGDGEGNFMPNDPVTREQMAAIFHRYAGYKGYDVTAQGDLSAFTDADSVSDWAREPLVWAVDKGLINGMGDGTVNPRGTATRAQTAAILMRFCETVAKPQQ